MQYRMEQGGPAELRHLPATDTHDLVAGDRVGVLTVEQVVYSE
jgi:hypothetical protein